MKGFILVEFLVSMLILGFIMAGIYGVLYVSGDTYNTSLGLVDLQQQARLAIDGMTRELRQTKVAKIDDSRFPEEITFDIPPENFGDEWIESIRYYLDAANNRIIREHPVGMEKIVANNVSGLIFSLDDNVLDIRLTCAKGSPQRDLSFELKEQVRLRNE